MSDRHAVVALSFSLAAILLGLLFMREVDWRLKDWLVRRRAARRKGMLNG